MPHTVLRYKASGLDMVSDFYVGEGGHQRPGVLVFSGGGGLSDHYRGLAQKFANLGYAALACDLHGGARQGDHDLRVALPRVQALMANPADLSGRGIGALEALRQRPEVDSRRISAVGYCLGGIQSLEMVRGGADLAAVVAVHTPVAALGPVGVDQIRAKILVVNGTEDHTVTPEHYKRFEDEMRQKKADWQLLLLGGVVHSFTLPDAVAFKNPNNRYDDKATQRTWRRTVDLLAEVAGT